MSDVLEFPDPPRRPTQTEPTAWTPTVGDPMENMVAIARRLRMRLRRPDDEEAIVLLVETITTGGQLACAPDVYARLSQLSPEDRAVLGGGRPIIESSLLPAGTLAAVPRDWRVAGVERTTIL
jgi:hypothetical protein